MATTFLQRRRKIFDNEDELDLITFTDFKIVLRNLDIFGDYPKREDKTKEQFNIERKQWFYQYFKELKKHRDELKKIEHWR